VVGGTIVGVVRYGRGEPTLLNVAGTGREVGSSCCIRVQEATGPRAISPHDRVWWQGDTAFWSAENSDFRDVPLVRVGGSFHFSGEREP
jgi:hypothetical protein